MRKIFLLAAAIAVVLTLSLGFGYAQTPVQGYSQGGWYCPWHNQSMNQGYARRNTGGWYCPWCGAGMGPGMMHHRDYSMMQRGQGQGAQQVAPGQTPGKPLTEDQAKLLLENYLKNTNNPNLKLGGITSKDGFYEAQIVTKDGSMVDKIQVDKNTGWFRSAY